MAARRLRGCIFVSCALLVGIVLAACSGPATPSATPGPTATATATPSVVATASGPSPTPLAVLPSPTTARPGTVTPTAPTATAPAATASATATAAAQQPNDPASAVRLAYSTTSAVRSFRFTATTGVSVVGKNMPATTFTTTGEEVLPDRIHATTSVSGTSTVSIDVIETIRIGTDIYLHLPASLAPNGKDQWVLLDTFGNFFHDVVGGSSASQSPMDAVAILKDVQNVQAVGVETVNGVATMHYRGTVRAASVSANNPISDFINGLISRIEQPTTTVDVWVGRDDNLVRRLTITNSTRLDLGNIGRASTPVPATSGPPTTESTLTFDLTDFGANLTIAPPPVFTRFSDLFGNLDPRNLVPPRTPPKPQV